MKNPERCPVADHLDDVAIGNLDRAKLSVVAIRNKNPMLPMVLVLMDMMQPSPIEFFDDIVASVRSVEICVVGIPLLVAHLGMVVLQNLSLGFIDFFVAKPSKRADPLEMVKGDSHGVHVRLNILRVVNVSVLHH